MKESSLLSSLLDFVYPPLCLGCAEYTENEYDLCEDCLAKIAQYDYPFCLRCAVQLDEDKCAICGSQTLPVYAYGPYRDPLKEIIIQFKFKGMTKAATYFAGVLSDKYVPKIRLVENPVLVPVPLHPSHLAKRGYNQAEVLCRALADKLELPMETELLFRTSGKKQQARLKPKERLENIKGVFELNDGITEKKNIILVDDVVTTGATISEAVKTLEEKGNQVKAAIALAHAD